MKIAIVSDLHLGYELFREDAFNQAKQALDIAYELSDMILIPGDIFDVHYPRPDVIAEAVNLFRNLSKKEWNSKIIEVKGAKTFTNIPIIAIPGNHEITSQNTQNAVKLLSLAGLLVDTSGAYTIVQKEDEKIAIFGLSNISDSSIKQKLKELNPIPISNAFNIFMFHQTIYEIMPFNENFMRLNDLPENFDLYICGHLHYFVDKTIYGKKLLIPGSTVLTHLSDIEKTKGFILFDTKKYTYDFIKIESRKFEVKTIEFDNAEDTEILEQCESQINIIIKNFKNPIIKIYLKGTANLLNFSLIIQKLKMKYLNNAYLSINSNNLIDTINEKDIEEIRDNTIDQMPIKEQGNIMFNKRLKDLDFNFSSINADLLFELLSQETNREKMLKKVLLFLEI